MIMIQSDIKSMLKELLKDDYEEIFFGEVVDVKENGDFINVKSNLIGNIIQGVTTISANNDLGIKFIPNVGSKCILIRYGRSYFATGFSDLKHIHLGGVDNLGLVKVKELTKRLNDMEKVMTSLQKTINTHTHTVQVNTGTGTGATTTQNLIDTSLISNSKVKDFENDRVKH